MSKVVTAECADPFPQGNTVTFEISPHGRHVGDGVGYHHLAPAIGVLVDAVQVAAPGMAPAGVVPGDGGGHLRHRVPGVDHAQDGQEGRSRVSEQPVSVSPRRPGRNGAGEGAVAPHQVQAGQAAVRLSRLPQAFFGYQLPLVADLAARSRQRLIAAGSGPGLTTAGIWSPMRCRLTGGMALSPAGRDIGGRSVGGCRRWSWACLRRGDFSKQKMRDKPIIAQRTDVRNSSFAPLFQGVWSTSGW